MAAKQHKQSLLKKKHAMKRQVLNRTTREYPSACGLLTSWQSGSDYGVSGPIAQICFHPLSLWVAVGRADGVVEVAKLPVKDGKPPVIITPDGGGGGSKPSWSCGGGRNLLSYVDAVYDMDKAGASTRCECTSCEATTQEAVSQSRKLTFLVAETHVRMYL